MDSVNQKLSFALPDEVQKEKTGGLGPIREEGAVPQHVSHPSAPSLLTKDDSFGLSELGDQLAAQRAQDQSHQKQQSLNVFDSLGDLLAG